MKTLETTPLAPGLYLVATPIGNLRDITLRALDVLAAADLVVCEDTRVSGKLMQAYGIKAKLLPYNDHNAGKQRGPIIEKLSAGGRVALISDAGTPLISDPGYKLVRDCLDLGLMVTTLPGANAVLPAIQLSGLPSDRFTFAGFAPPKSTARREWLRPLLAAPGTLVTYESGPRLAASLADMAAVLGDDRPAAVVREITKMFEESRRGTLRELADHYAAADTTRGEIVIVIGEGIEAQADEAQVDVMLLSALKTMSVRDAAAHVATATGLPKKQIYERALAVQADDQED
ncbi:MAG: 16S rRNA (cytidine(1402)-2'-O)-methyltransferase [Alphaproteobacteria bacterium]|nr:16S rRNA (cytidine(1402)-2'-O)-methyltransferase [Alphaproteobacteria bacterium]MBU0859473.1 16S rRNA (cytidine(1402)-2'-O)-methyltransferase [Alphaproteobacteria bacterium]